MQDKQTWQSGAQRLFALPPAFSPSPLHFLQAEKKKKKEVKKLESFGRNKSASVDSVSPPPTKTSTQGLKEFAGRDLPKTL